VLSCDSPTGLDWAEPRWRSQVEKTTSDATARNSDCQFCSVRFQKSDVPAYCPSVSGASRWSSWSASYSMRPVRSCANQDASQIAAMTATRELE
jgi:hypothetical protein